jgi:hypothetical protein
MAQITVTGEPKPKEDSKNPLKGKDAPFGETTYANDIDIINIKMRCKDAFAKHPDFEGQGQAEPSEDHKNCTCRCYLKSCTITVNFKIRFNPKKIKDGWFDPKTLEGYTGAKKEGSYKLDEESVRVHELEHCKDASEKIAAAVQKALDKLADSLFAECKCDNRAECEKRIKKLIQAQIEAIGADEFAKLAGDSIGHNSPAEKRAREAQLKYFQDKEKK